MEVRVLIRKSQRDLLAGLARLTDTPNATVTRSALYAGIHALLSFWARQWGLSDEWLRENMANLEPGPAPDHQPVLPHSKDDNLPF